MLYKFYEIVITSNTVYSDGETVTHKPIITTDFTKPGKHNNFTQFLDYVKWYKNEGYTVNYRKRTQCGMIINLQYNGCFTSFVTIIITETYKEENNQSPRH